MFKALKPLIVISIIGIASILCLGLYRKGYDEGYKDCGDLAKEMMATQQQNELREKYQGLLKKAKDAKKELARLAQEKKDMDDAMKTLAEIREQQHKADEAIKAISVEVDAIDAKRRSKP